MIFSSLISPMKKRFPLSLLGLMVVCSYSTIAQATLPSGSDNFADAPLITSQNDVSGFTNLLGATEEVDEPKHRPDSAPGDGQTVWWKWTAPENGFCTVDTLTPFPFNVPLLDTVLGVYTGTALNALTRVAANDDHASFYFSNNYGQSKATFFATAGVTYYIAVDGPYDGVIIPTAFGTVLRLRQERVVEQLLEGDRLRTCMQGDLHKAIPATKMSALFSLRKRQHPSDRAP